MERIHSKNNQLSEQQKICTYLSVVDQKRQSPETLLKVNTDTKQHC